MKSANGPFLCEFLPRRASGGKIENKNLKSAQKPPYSLVVVCRPRVLKMHSESIHEAAHVIIGGARSVDSVYESCTGPQLAGPRQNILIGSVNLPGSSRNGNSQFIPGVQEFRFARDFGNLAHD